MDEAGTACRDPGLEVSRAARIAIVDDDTSVRTAISRFLKIANFNVDLYGRSIDFLESLGRERPDCLVLDLHMPTLTGIDVMKYLRASNIDFAVVIVSADDEPIMRETCSNLGAVCFLRKPLDGDLLLRVLEAVRSRPAKGQDRAGLGIPMTDRTNGHIAPRSNPPGAS
jgi:FixJ family two-component response regulator